MLQARLLTLQVRYYEKLKKALLMLYHAYIFPYMTYCIEVWGCASQTQLNCLFLLQKKIIRI